MSNGQGGTPKERLRRDLVLVIVLMLCLYALFTILAYGAGRDLSGILAALRTITFLSAVYAIAALALNLQWGYAGLLNLGVAGFMAVGVYTMALLSTPVDATYPGLGLPLPVGMIGGFVAASIIGAIAALPALRLKADYLAIVTLAVGEIIRLTFRTRALSEFSIAGWELGFGGTDARNLPADPIRWLLYEEPNSLISDPNPLGFYLFEAGEALSIRSSTIEGWLYAILVIVFLVIIYLMLLRISNSPTGRVLKAIREDELVASSLGKDVRNFKIKTFALGCGLMGIAGMLWWLQRGSVSVDTFDPELTFFIFVALFIGGAGSNTGSVVGGILFASVLFEGPRWIQRIVSSHISRGSRPDTIFEAFTDTGAFVDYFFSDVSISAIRLIVLGVILIYIMQRRPHGIFGDRIEVASSIDLTQRGTPEERN